MLDKWRFTATVARSLELYQDTENIPVIFDTISGCDGGVIERANAAENITLTGHCVPLVHAKLQAVNGKT